MFKKCVVGLGLLLGVIAGFCVMNRGQHEAGLPLARAAEDANTDYRKATSTAEAQRLYVHVEPDWDAGADPEVTAEQGGKGFTGEGWETNTTYNYTGDPRAKKGGELKLSVGYSFDSITYYTKTGRISTMSTWMGLTHDSLIGFDPITQDTVPGLATHWKISEDKKQYWFRINPSARWSDGTPVTADDVVSTYVLMCDPTLERPDLVETYGESFDEPVAESKYIVRFDVKKPEWRNLVRISSLAILPGAILDRINGEQFNQKFQTEQIMGSGPYWVKKEDVKPGESISFMRRTDYWAEKARGNIGSYNFDRLTWEVVIDSSITFEKLQKGGFDFYLMPRAQWWVERCGGGEDPARADEPILKGWIQRRRVFNDNPQGMSGLAFNMRKPPFDDIRVRKAFTMLWDIDKLLEKKFFKQYSHMISYFPVDVFSYRGEPKLKYDPQQAEALLNEAGWKRNVDGWMERDGKLLECTLNFSEPFWSEIHAILQEDLKKAGIKLELKQEDWATSLKRVQELEFDLHMSSYVGSLYPDPKFFWHSKFADVKNSVNITGFKNEKVDQLCEQFDIEFDFKKRCDIVRQIDAILQGEHPYALAWQAGYIRVLYWNKFSMPDCYFSKFGDEDGALGLWWYDAEKDAALKKTMKEAGNLPQPEPDCHPWGSGGSQE